MSADILRSILFVPASRPERIPKALASGADAVIVDLEDAVAAADKTRARAALARFLEDNPDAGVWVRVNAQGRPAFRDDLAVCARHAGVAGIMVPKAETVQALTRVATCGKPVWPLIETAAAFPALPELARVAGVERLAFGALDLGADLGLVAGSQGAQGVLDHCRCQLVLQSRAAGLAAPIDSVHPAIDQQEAVEQAARRAREMGFAGMLCIHPRQLPPIHRGFSPGAAELEWARQVVQRADRGESVFSVDGQMVDAPVIARARAMLARDGGR